MRFNSVMIVKKRNNLGRADELGGLRERMRMIRSRLYRLDKRIGELQGRRVAGDLKAVVDPRRCAGCGICADNCPEGAIVIEETACIDVARCKGCGICMSVCPRGAISLRWS